MTRLNKALVLVTLALIAIVAFLLEFQPREPSYQGRQLSEWLRIARGEGADRTVRPEAAKTAIQAIGTNAVPCLVSWIENSEIPRKRPLGIILKSYLSPWSHRSSDQAYRWDVYRRPEDACWAFGVLGNRAVSAIPDLTRIMNSTNSPKASINAMMALCYIGPESASPLTNLLSDPHNPTGMELARQIYTLSQWGTNTMVTLPILLKWTTDQDERIAGAGAVALGKLRLAPEMVIPVLTNRMSNAGPGLQSDIVNAIALFARSEPRVVQVLTEMLQAPQVEVRRAAIVGLYGISLRGEADVTAAYPALVHAMSDPQPRVNEAVKVFFPNLDRLVPVKPVSE